MPSVLNIVKCENGWIVCVDVDFHRACEGRRFVFNTAEALAADLPELLRTGAVRKKIEEALDGVGLTD